MAFELKQNLKLSQQLIMTPQLQQAIKLLQLSRLEMVDMINQEMEENPLLEEISPAEDIVEETPAESDNLRTLESDEIKAVEHTVEITGEGDGREDFDWNNYLEDYGPMGVTYQRAEDEGMSWDNVLTKTPSLTDHLMWQLKLSPLTEEEMRVGEQIIGNLDQNGYLMATVEEIAAQEQVDAAVVDRVLMTVQGFDPPGIAARDLTECLLIQARLLGDANPLVATIIRDHLKELETKNYHQIAKKLKVEVDEVVQAVMVISNMDPKPGSLFQEERVQTVIPDVFVYKSGEDYKIVLNEDGMPRLRISNFYREIMAGMDGGRDADTGKKYIKERVQSATWLIKSIQQRQKTIYKVTESIVNHQRDFFEKGINHLKPLVLRDIAMDVDMHESTISRVVTNKYMQSPAGLFELKYFFSSGLSKGNGENIASKSVKEEIRKLISEENPKKPLSDNEIVVLLKASGIRIARRTVAKYREMMNILPSSRRKKFF
ncbi:MAG TPA: RNA polymerase factor sigma-54 [Syntrophales bacterium]|jgi:RNA polymerase sigma-54 factor|nr:RNA polymerase factor sigma-54 [Syntrophales bacterium]HON23419.1 RNA polymerase factor sigma-54 [Syntrophales bacterium]HOU77004.1 RNA polymerase factor sigma-54 [Syntrophales bacterium]HPC32284.1 RNA polymerase factor sigma-54 [Syntrophales bacterium]HQG34026.1 RNA polymerase factor sigma-54 [Syntrophales bacterium]